MLRSGNTKNLCLNRLKSTMKKKRNELLDFSLKNDRKLFKQQKRNQKCTSTLVVMYQMQPPKQKLKKRAEKVNCDM